MCSNIVNKRVGVCNMHSCADGQFTVIMYQLTTVHLTNLPTTTSTSYVHNHGFNVIKEISKQYTIIHMN